MKIRTADLTGAQLDYHTACAQGIPAERLEIRRVPRTDTLICVSLVPVVSVPGYAAQAPMPVAMHYSTDWHLAGALIEQHHMTLEFWPNQRPGGEWAAGQLLEEKGLYNGFGPTPQVAICRAVVRAAFGEEVEKVAVCE